jgi:hypothetical protein
MTADETKRRRKPGKRHTSGWPEGSDADRAEGSLAWAERDEDDERVGPSMLPDAPEADVLEQSEPADLDDDDRAR